MDTYQVKAAVLDSTNPRHLDIQEFEIPAMPQDDQLLIRTMLAGICGSDLHFFTGGSAPGLVIPGHEFVGEVVNAGENFRDANGMPLTVGDRVVAESTIPCGECVYCRGVGSRYDKWVDYAACETYTLFGNIPLGEPLWLSGGYSEMVQIPRGGLVHKIPDQIDIEEAVLLEPLSVAVRASLRAGVSSGDTVVVLGPGPIGQLCLVAAQAAGATDLILVGVDGDEARLTMGKELGANRVVNASRENGLEILLDLTGGRRADRVIDATGAPPAFWQGVEMTARGGVYVCMGGFPADQAISIYPDYLIRNKIDIRFSHTGANSFHRALNIIASKRFPLRKLITRRIPLEGAEAALNAMLKRRGDDLKVVIEMAS